MGDNILFLFPIIFIATWFFVIFLMSLIGGWYNLSKKYPYKNKKDISEKLYKRQSVTLNFIGRYRYCINVTIFYDGFLLSPTLFYSFFHKSIFIEYKQILIYRFFNYKFRWEKNKNFRGFNKRVKK